MSWIPIIQHTLIKYNNSPDDPSLMKYFENRDEKEFSRFHTMSKRKITKRNGFKCRVCNQSLVDNENLEVNYIIPKILVEKTNMKTWNFCMLVALSNTNCYFLVMEAKN